MDYNKSMMFDSFYELLGIMYERCDLNLTEKRAKLWYNDFGNTPKDVLIPALKRIQEAAPRKITYTLLKNAISESTPKKQNNTKLGCEYCDSAGLIQYYVEKNNTRYEYSARCHMCRTSPIKHMPFYNEVFPHDRLEPHSTKEQMKPMNQDVRDIVKTLTRREHEDSGYEEFRKRQLFKEKQLETVE